MHPRILSILLTLKLHTEIILSAIYSLGVIVVACILGWRQSVKFSLAQTGNDGLMLSVNSEDLSSLMDTLSLRAPGMFPTSMDEITFKPAVYLAILFGIFIFSILLARLPKLNVKYPKVVVAVFTVYPLIELLTLLAEWYTFIYFGGLSLFAYQSVPAQPLLTVQIIGLLLAVRHVVLGTLILDQFSKLHVVAGAVVDVSFVIAAVVFTRPLTAISPFVEYLLWLPLFNQGIHLLILVGSTVGNQIPLIPAGEAWAVRVKPAKIIWFSLVVFTGLIPAALPFVSGLYFPCPASSIASKDSHCSVRTQPLFGPCDCLSLQVSEIEVCATTSESANFKLAGIVGAVPTVTTFWITDFSGTLTCPTFEGFRALADLPHLEMIRVKGMVANSGLGTLGSFPVEVVTLVSLLVVQLNGLRLGSLPLKLGSSVQLLDYRNNSVPSVTPNNWNVLLNGNPICSSGASLTPNLHC